MSTAETFDESKVTRDEKGRFALKGSAGGNAAQIASANMTGVKSDKNQYKKPSVEAMMGVGDNNPKNAAIYEKNFEKDIALFKDAKYYPNFRESDLKGTPQENAKVIVDHMASNLEFLYKNTTPEIREAGMKWYDGAHNLIADTAKQFGLNEASTVGAFAKLSPNKDWNMNIELGKRISEIYATKQDFRYDDKMAEQAKLTFSPKGIKDEKSKEYKEKSADLAKLNDAMKGKTFRELDDQPLVQAAWARLYDEAHNPAGATYHIFQGDGTLSKDVARNLPDKANPEGKPSTLVWQSNKLMSDAIASLKANGDRSIISEKMGDGHKVRSFYNNLLDPHSPNEDVTIDTHAVGAALLRPLGGKSVPVNQNFGLTPMNKPADFKPASGSAVTGLSGTYGLYADATRLAAKRVGIEPMQMQAITWEAKRSLLGDLSKEGSDRIEKLWTDYHAGKIKTLSEVQRAVFKAAQEDNQKTADARGSKAKKVKK